MGSQRPRLGFDIGEPFDEEQTDIGEFARKEQIHKKPRIDPVKVQELAEASGFTSRQPIRRRIKKRSPYIIQANLKTRIGMKELLQELSDRLEKYDQETFELAILALLEKEGIEDLKKQYKELVKPRSRPIL